mmetsp:Transcript_100926/g.301095  ORF Transcript_100926/g.301095 Transcript_100926/m.301095 type:complete len:221 (-) Transcript_100926:295-957(-)
MPPGHQLVRPLREDCSLNALQFLREHLHAVLALREPLLRQALAERRAALGRGGQVSHLLRALSNPGQCLADSPLEPADPPQLGDLVLQKGVGDPALTPALGRVFDAEPLAAEAPAAVVADDDLQAIPRLGAHDSLHAHRVVVCQHGGQLDDVVRGHPAGRAARAAATVSPPSDIAAKDLELVARLELPEGRRVTSVSVSRSLLGSVESHQSDAIPAPALG